MKHQLLASSAIEGRQIDLDVLATPTEVLARNVFLHLDHKHYVQGVAVDASSQTLASIPNDRYLRIYKVLRMFFISSLFYTKIPGIFSNVASTFANDVCRALGTSSNSGRSGEGPKGSEEFQIVSR